MFCPMRYRLCLCLFAVVTNLAAREVYRSTETGAGTEYSDTPRVGSTRLEVPAPTLMPSVPVVRTPTYTAPIANPSPQAMPYTQFVLVTPRDAETIHNGGGEIAVTVASEPALQAALGHRLQVVIDGVPTGSLATRADFTVSAIDRGAHRLAVTIVDAKHRVLARTKPIQIFLHRRSLKSALNKPIQKPEAK